jgi:hypothetical protein
LQYGHIGINDKFLGADFALVDDLLLYFFTPAHIHLEEESSKKRTLMQHRALSWQVGFAIPKKMGFCTSGKSEDFLSYSLLLSKAGNDTIIILFVTFPRHLDSKIG